ncbi:MAG: hypothetical protein II119_04315 [Bacilli bacterium]|nr:hypothetical protein [Bacilli bacterium]MBQ6281966.1 hypothetical protein [Bacilli bacterium]
MKKRLILLIAFVLIFTLLVFVDTFALFETVGVANKDLEIGKWSIVLNDIDISTERVITLDDFSYSQSSHTEPGYFAPGMSATFDIVIDTTLSDVSVAYTLDIDGESLEDYPNIYFSIRDMDTNQEIISNTYSNIIRLSDQNKIKTIRISLTWDNDTQYDESDTSLIGQDIEIPINANFIQYTGE